MERLVNMLQQDPRVGIVTRDSIYFINPEIFVQADALSSVPPPECPITPTRWAQYVKIMDEEQLPYGATRCGPNVFAIPIYVRGFLLHGNEAGYIYSAEAFRATGECIGYSTAHIDGPWYAYNTGL